MDMYIHYGANTFEKFQARNFGGDSRGDWKLELKGQFAAQGKIQGRVVLIYLQMQDLVVFHKKQTGLNVV